MDAEGFLSNTATTTRYYDTHTGMTQIQKTDTTKLWLQWRTTEIFIHQYSLPVAMENGTATLEDSLAVSYKTKHTLTVHAC